MTGDGTGGRNQGLALSAGLALQGDHRIVLVSFGTDGVDGPTDAAGGIADGATVTRGKRLGLDAASAIERHDSYSYLRSISDQLRTGPTGTNVADLVLAYRSE